MDKFTEEELDEFDEKVYESEDPTQFPDDVLAALWRRNWNREKRMKHGERELHWRRHQMSLAVNIMQTFCKDCSEVAKTKLNIQRTRLLALADKFDSLSSEMRVLLIRYEKFDGWKKAKC